MKLVFQFTDSIYNQHLPRLKTNLKVTLRIATWYKDKTIKLWNVERAEEISTLQSHKGWVSSVSFSPDGKILASASDDKIIKLWNVERGEEILTLQGHEDWISSDSFSPDGKTLASASEDQTIKLWNLDLDFLIERSCDHVGNYLQHNPNVKKTDKKLCDGIGTQN